MDGKYQVRLAILTALTNQPAPVDMERLTGALELQAAGVTAAEVRRELPGLKDHGYVTDHLAHQAPNTCLTVSAAGRDQVRRDAPMDVYVYGPMAHAG